MIKKMLERNEMANRLVDVTVEMIEENGGLQGVNLRQIAKRANCAHTNIYNYYQDFEDLLWDVFARIEEKWDAESLPDLDAGQPLEQVVESFTRTQIDFGLTHPGWYRCLWSEPLSRKPPEQIRDARRARRDDMVKVILKAMPGLTVEEGNNLFQILFSYTHGSISLLINNRIYRSEPDEYKKKIIKNTLMIVRSLGGSHE
jgi:AcrR family transcriptional regulator